ncbi:MAG: sugar transferase [Clostridia bacterium]|nr:sugar transferase [Clostridia bacterium]
MERDNFFKNYIIFLIDIVTVAVVFALVIFISNPPDEFIDRIINIRKIIYAPILTVVIVFILLDMNKSAYKRYSEVIFNSMVASVLGFLSFYIFINIRNWHLVHIHISFFFILMILTALIVVERLLLELIIRRTLTVDSLMIVANESDAYKIAHNLLENKLTSIRVSSIFLVDDGIRGIEEAMLHCDKIVLGADIIQENRSDIINICQKIHKKVFVIPEIYDISIMRPRLTQIDDTPYLYLDNIGLSAVEQDFKRLMDILISTLLIIILSPVMLICALMIKITSRGPVFFLQDRVTINNKVFKIIKFRTMIDNAEKHTGAVLASSNDERVTKFGSLLRRSRLDEIPQLFNVIKGDMSLIGPRPERPVFVEQFEKMIPLYNKRHSIKAGVTGLAQIMGKYSTSAKDKLRYDLIYIRSYSVYMDIKILFLTLRTVILDLGSMKTDQKTGYANELNNENIKIIKG